MCHETGFHPSKPGMKFKKPPLSMGDENVLQEPHSVKPLCQKIDCNPELFPVLFEKA